MNGPPTEEIIQYLKMSRRFDPHAHSSANFDSALRNRLDLLNMTPEAYMDELQVRPGEINVLLSSMLERKPLFQDTEAWTAVRDLVVAKLASSSAPVRIWAVSCGNGLDAYALAVMLAEATNPSEFSARVKIFATDEDDKELAIGRAGIFDREQLAILDEETLYRYFSSHGENRFVFRSDLRKLLIFGKHRFLEDAPISRMDLVICRYRLALQEYETQQKTLSRLLFSLDTGGFALIGVGEGIPSGSGFQPVESCPMLFRKVIRNRPHLGEPTPRSVASNPKLMMLEEAALDACAPAQIVVDAFGVIALANQRARTTFGITANDVGRPLQELEISYRPLELRSLIDRVSREGGVITIPHVMKVSVDGPVHFEVVLKPLVHNTRMIATSIQYIDISSRHELSNQVGILHEQLQAANEELHSAHEELVTTNEELQSTNEELETTNEELQSTNEELETMNEELRSTNTELESSNWAQRTVTHRIETNNTFLASVVDNLGASIIVLNQSHQVLVWNEHASHIWGLRQDEVLGRNLFALDIGFPVHELKEPLRSVGVSADAKISLVTEAVNRRGKKIKCRVTAHQLCSKSPKGVLVVIAELMPSESARSGDPA